MLTKWRYGQNEKPQAVYAAVIVDIAAVSAENFLHATTPVLLYMHASKVLCGVPWQLRGWIRGWILAYTQYQSKVCCESMQNPVLPALTAYAHVVNFRLPRALPVTRVTPCVLSYKLPS